MDNCVQDILRDCERVSIKPTPASTLFDVRGDARKVPSDERQSFHASVARVLYLAKRVRLECLPAVAFLTTRVNSCDVDDWGKLRRLLGSLKGTADRGITLRIGEFMTVVRCALRKWQVEHRLRDRARRLWCSVREIIQAEDSDKV
jgi:hypothetical protein